MVWPRNPITRFFRRRRTLGFDARDDETQCRFVSSHGLLRAAEVHPPHPERPHRKLPDIRRHRAGGRIYVHADQLPAFADTRLPRLRAPFTLLTGNGDETISPEARGPAFDRIAGHPELTAWFAQNAVGAHPRLHPLPIGQDYHTLARGVRIKWGAQASPRAQEDLLDVLRRGAVPLADRKVVGFCNWHFALGNGDRAAVMDRLPKAAVAYAPRQVPRTESWIENAGHLFTISPPGKGPDCHRTWEAIALGSVPIVEALPLNRVFDGLPFVAVSDWADVTPAFLERERARVLETTFDFAPMMLAHWLARTEGRQTPPLRMTFETFLRTPPAALAAALGD